MSKATKRKHVTRQVVEEFIEPQGSQKIVKVLCGRGNNLHQVEEAGGLKFLASMPTKFRKNVWIKRGDYVVVDPIEEGNKVQAEITHILYPQQIKYLKENNHWPSEFEDSSKHHLSFGEREERKSSQVPEAVAIGHEKDDKEEEEEEDDDDGDLFVNPNRPPPITTSSEEDED